MADTRLILSIILKGASPFVPPLCLWYLLSPPSLKSKTWILKVASVSLVALPGCLWYLLLIAPSLDAVPESLESKLLKVASLLVLTGYLQYFFIASLESKVLILKGASLLALTGCLWYLLIAPSLKLDDDIRKKFHIQWNNLNEKQQWYARELAKFDLEKKVYPEIQDRLTKINDWFINKIIFAGGLLGAFLLQLWWPFWSRDISLKEREEEAEDIFTDLLRSAPVCAVLGLACVVSLFMDIHVRRSLIVIHQLGVWAAEYGTVALGGCYEQFPAWEQFIRMPAAGSTQQSSPCTQQSSPDMQGVKAAQPPDPGAQASNSAQKPKPGMHDSLIDAVQTGNLSLMTLVIFAFYYWTFQTVCCNKEGLDEFNRLTYGLVIAILLVFLLMTHRTSGNFVFTGYGHTFWFSNFWGYFAAWSGITLLMVVWDFANTNMAKRLA